MVTDGHFGIARIQPTDQHTLPASPESHRRDSDLLPGLAWLGNNPCAVFGRRQGKNVFHKLGAVAVLEFRGKGFALKGVPRTAKNSGGGFIQILDLTRGNLDQHKSLARDAHQHPVAGIIFALFFVALFQCQLCTHQLLLSFDYVAQVPTQHQDGIFDAVALMDRIFDGILPFLAVAVV